MLKKNCHKFFGSQKSKLTVLEQDFQTAGVINHHPIRDRDNTILVLGKPLKRHPVSYHGNS